jgi:hypothetical protein
VIGQKHVTSWDSLRGPSEPSAQTPLGLSVGSLLPSWGWGTPCNEGLLICSQTRSVTGYLYCCSHPERPGNFQKIAGSGTALGEGNSGLYESLQEQRDLLSPSCRPAGYRVLSPIRTRTHKWGPPCYNPRGTHKRLSLQAEASLAVKKVLRL